MLQLSMRRRSLGPILPVLEQRPPKLLQARHQSGLGQRPRFVTADLIDRFIELPANVERSRMCSALSRCLTAARYGAHISEQT